MTALVRHDGVETAVHLYSTRREGLDAFIAFMRVHRPSVIRATLTEEQRERAREFLENEVHMITGIDCVLTALVVS